MMDPRVDVAEAADLLDQPWEIVETHQQHHQIAEDCEDVACLDGRKLTGSEQNGDDRYQNEAFHQAKVDCLGVRQSNSPACDFVEVVSDFNLVTRLNDVDFAFEFVMQSSTESTRPTGVKPTQKSCGNQQAQAAGNDHPVVPGEHDDRPGHRKADFHHHGDRVLEKFDELPGERRSCRDSGDIHASDTLRDDHPCRDVRVDRRKSPSVVDLPGEAHDQVQDMLADEDAYSDHPAGQQVVDGPAQRERLRKSQQVFDREERVRRENPKPVLCKECLQAYRRRVRNRAAAGRVFQFARRGNRS